jgi:gliding motility-associated-like protein
MCTTNAIWAQEPFVCTGQYFLSLSQTASSTSGLYLVEIDPLSGNTVFTPIATSVGATVNAMGYRNIDNFIYGLNPGSAIRLYRLGADGIAVDLGIPQDVIFDGNYYYAGDVTPDGKYLVVLGQNFNDPNGILGFIDLDHPDYQVTSVPLISTFTGIYDIAFDLYTEELYGFSTGNARLVKIDVNTGEVTSDFPEQPQVNQLGALFFDVSGNLFGYGSIDGQSTLVSIDKETGVMSSIAFGPSSGGEDGCSCPYTVDLKKSVSIDLAYPCTQVIYTFVITNGSGILQTGLQLTDVMPEEFTVLEIISNPFGGTEVIGGHVLDISGMSVPPGSDSLIVLVEIGENSLGNYQNQAVLTGLPETLGGATVSDNPATLAALDSTPIYIAPLEITFIEEEYMICPGESVVINASLYGVDYLWENGSEVPIRVLEEPGSYSVSVTSNCDQVVADIEVIMELNYINLQEEYFICVDELLEIDVSPYGDDFLWEDGSVNAQRIFMEEGAYAVTATSNCIVTTIDYDIFAEDFYVNIIPEVVDIELGDMAILNSDYWAGNNNVTIQWSDPLGNSLSCLDCNITAAFPFETVTYTLKMAVENGCTYQDDVLVRVNKDRTVFIPNVISPNFDGINDYFYVQSKKNNVKINSMSIYDRWGSLVHKADNIDINSEGQGWDATYAGEPVQSGVYVYVIELEFIDGAIILESGDVTVLR